MRAGDEILSVNGAPIRSIDELAPRINATGCKPFTVEVRRGAERVSLAIRGEMDGTSCRMGVQLKTGPTFERASFGGAVFEGALFPVRMTREMLSRFSERSSGIDQLGS
jgi:hypothetical protein